VNKQEKKVVVDQFKEDFPKIKGMVFTDITGMDAASMTDIRKNLKKSNAQFHVIKNTLGRIAITEYTKELDGLFHGPTSVAYSFDDEMITAKILCQIEKENEKLKIKGGYVAGKVYSASQVRTLSTIPGKQQLYARLCQVLNSPIVRLVTALSEPQRKLVCAMKGVADKKEKIN